MLVFIFDRYRFDSFHNSQKMAEGVSVHANSLEEAIDMATALCLKNYGSGYTLRFVGAGPDKARDNGRF